VSSSFSVVRWEKERCGLRVRYWEWEVLTDSRYHHLNHYAIFGSGYKGGAIKIMRSLLKKYGEME